MLDRCGSFRSFWRDEELGLLRLEPRETLEVEGMPGVKISGMGGTEPSLALRGWEPRFDDGGGGGSIASAGSSEACTSATSLAFPLPFETKEGQSLTDADFIGDIFFETIFIAGELFRVVDGTLGLSFALAGCVDGPAEIVAASETRSSVVARRVLREDDPDATAAAADLEIRSWGALYYEQNTQRVTSKNCNTHTSKKT
jgi:hypothetical protein